MPSNQHRLAVGKAAEHQATEDRHAQLGRVMVVLAETFGHAARTVDPAFECHALEVALEAVGPGVVHALEVLGALAVVLEADERAAVRAAVGQHQHPAGAVADEHLANLEKNDGESKPQLHWPAGYPPQAASAIVLKVGIGMTSALPQQRT